MTKAKPLDPHIGGQAYQIVKRMVDAKQPWVPHDLIAEVLRWVVLPDDLKKEQAEHNVELLLSRSREISEVELFQIPFSVHDDARTTTFFNVTSRHMQIFANLVREQTINELRNKEQPK